LNFGSKSKSSSSESEIAQSLLPASSTMDKQPAPGYPGDDFDLPPPYTPSASSSSKTSQSLSQKFNLETRILAHILEDLQSLLPSIEDMWPPPSLVEATFVPGASVGPQWTLSDPAEKSKKEISRVFRIQVDKEDPTQGKEKISHGSLIEGVKDRERGFDAWGRFDDETSTEEPSVLWWSDEDMAYKLARKLQAQHLLPSSPRTAASASSASAAGASTIASLRSGLRTLMESFQDPQRVWPPPPPAPASASRSAPKAESSPATMNVRAEEVTFRRENEMGIWESKTGWGIVARIRISQG
jgi:hypothetical protein